MSRYNDPDVLELAAKRGGRKRRALAEIKRAEAEARNARTLPHKRRAYWREWAVEIVESTEVITGVCPWPEKTPYENESIALAALAGISRHKRKLQGLHPYPCKPTGHWHLGRLLRRSSVAWKRAA